MTTTTFLKSTLFSLVALVALGSTPAFAEEAPGEAQEEHNAETREENARLKNARRKMAKRVHEARRQQENDAGKEDCQCDPEHLRERFNRFYFGKAYTKARYEKADTDQNGTLSYQEWDTELRDREQGCHRFKAKDADTDGDGEITLEEAKAARKANLNPTAKVAFEAWKKRHNCDQ